MCDNIVSVNHYYYYTLAIYYYGRQAKKTKLKKMGTHIFFINTIKTMKKYYNIKTTQLQK